MAEGVQTLLRGLRRANCNVLSMAFSPTKLGRESLLPPGAVLALRRTLAHAAEHSPYYRNQPWAARLRAGVPVTIDDIPETRKETVRDTPVAFESQWAPPEDGSISVKDTSGSTGIPLHVPKTKLHFAVNAAENKMLKAGWNFEVHQLHVIVTNSEVGKKLNELETFTGSDGLQMWKIHTGDSSAVAALLRKTQATLLHTRASVVRALLEDHPDIDFLRLISTVGDTVAPDFQRLLARIPDCRHCDVYGAVETGIIAATCATCGRYHVARRHLVTEILNDDGTETAPGELGRVVVTPLYNLAMPLIRYDIGDYAVRGTADACDGSGMSFDRVMGKQRDMFKLSDGSKALPYLVKPALFDLGIKQYRLIQTTLQDVEFRYVPVVAGFAVDRNAVQNLINESISPLLQVSCVQVDELPIKAHAKFRVYESLI